MKMKVCSKCKRRFPATIEYFYKRKSSKDGLRCQCKDCRNKYLIEYLKTPKGKESHRKSTEKYYNANKDKLLEISRLYRQTDKWKEVNRKSHKKYYKKNKEKCKEESRHQREINREYYLTYNKHYKTTKAGKESTKISNRKTRAKRRMMNYIEMFPNPFDDIELIDWHHITDTYVVALPRDLHRLYNGNTKYHRLACMCIVKQIYL